MKVKILPYIVFFLASLAFAWYASKPTSESDAAGKEWLSLNRASIQKISYSDETSKVTVTKDAGAFDAFWIDSTEKKKEGDKEVEVKEHYLVGERLNELLTSLTPFRAEKLIGEAGKVNLADFGLDKPTGTFEVQYGEGKTFSLSIGKRSFQSPHVFVLDKEKNMVLLVERKVMSMLEKPKARMALVKPFTFAEADLAQAQLSVDKKSETFTRKQQAENKNWFAEGKKDAPSEAFRNWLDKLLKLRVEGYPDEVQKAALAKLEPKFTLQLKSDREQLDTWSILEDPGTPSKYWLKTMKLPVPVLIDATKVPVLLNDLKALVP